MGADLMKNRSKGSRLDAIGGDEGLGVAVGRGDAGGGDGLISFDEGGDGEVEVEELFQEVGGGVEAVGGEDGGVEGGVGVVQGVLAGEFEGAVEGAETAIDVGESFGADATDFTAGGGDGVDLFSRQRLGPGEGVEDGFEGCRRNQTDLIRTAALVVAASFFVLRKYSIGVDSHFLLPAVFRYRGTGRVESANEQWTLCSRRSKRRTHRSRSALISCSQSLSTVQPRLRRTLACRRSRAIVSSIFSRHQAE